MRPVRYEDFTLGDLTAIRNLLRGGSVIDWHRLYFTDRDEVDRFLRVNELDPNDAHDMRRLGELRAAAVEYLERHLGLQIPDEVASGVPPRDLLLIASQKGRRRTHACGANRLDHREAIETREHPVGDDHVIAAAGRGEKRVMAVAQEVADMAGLGQSPDDVVRRPVVVLDKKKSHRCSGFADIGHRLPPAWARS